MRSSNPNPKDFPDLTLPEKSLRRECDPPSSEQIQDHPRDPEHIQAELNFGKSNLKQEADSTITSAPLLWIGLGYPLVNFMVLCFGFINLLRDNNFYCFSFVLPALTVVSVALLRLAGVFRFNWLAYPGFLAWMSLIGYLNMQLFYIAWAGV